MPGDDSAPIGGPLYSIQTFRHSPPQADVHITAPLLHAQDRVSIDLYSRGSDGRWVRDASNRLDGSVALAAIDCDLAVADIYARVPEV